MLGKLYRKSPAAALPLVLAGLLIIVFGVVKLPVEQALEAEYREAYFRSGKLDLNLRQRIGQLAFIAALSGFRSLVSDALWIQAHTAWENLEWEKMEFLFNNVVTLQPRVLMFWDLAAWHMAWNASVAAFHDKDQPRETVRKRNQREFFDVGRDFLERGIQNNPDRYMLYDRMAILLRDKYGDHCAAAEYFGKAAAFAEAPPYEKRFAAYELSKCPGKEKEAYEMLRALWEMGPEERRPTLITQLAKMEEVLGIPPEQRIVKPEQTAH